MTITRGQFNTYAKQKLQIDGAIEAAIDELWDLLDTSDLDALETDLALYLPLVADRYGRACAVAAADFYDTARNASKVRGSYRASTDVGALWHVDRDIKYAFGEGFAYASQKAFLTESVKQTARDYGHATIIGNSKRDLFCDGYCSVPTNDDPCVFCITKSLDTFYNFKGKKLEERIEEDAWHPGCKCELLPVWEDTPNWVEGDYERYESMYKAGREAAEAEARENGTWSGKLSVAEVQRGMRMANGITH